MTAVKLFDFQEEDRGKTVDLFLRDGKTKLLGVWPTGSGKAVLFSELHLEPRMADWLERFPEDKRQILILAHRDELITQAKDKVQRSNPDLAIGIEKAAQRSSLADDVVVASIQTLVASGAKRLRKLDPDRFRIVVVDEAHHAASPSYLRVLQHFGFVPPPDFMAQTRPNKNEGRAALLSWQRDRLAAWDQMQDTGALMPGTGVFEPQKRLLLGLTATPKRGDRIGLECAFQEIAFERTIREMIERGRLCPPRAYRVLTDTSLDDVGTRAGDFEQDKLALAVNVDPRNAKAVRAYLDYGENRKGVTFCANVAHATAMANAFRTAGITAEVIHGNLPTAERHRILKAYSQGEIKMLTNCNVLTEGWDEPDVGCVIHARPTKSSLLYVQMTGRGLRVHPGKKDCIIIDVVDITKRHTLVTAPELLGLPVGFDAKGGNLLDLKVAVEDVQKAHPLADLTDVKDIEDCKLRVAEVDLLNNFHDEVLDSHARLAWERIGNGYEISWRGQLLNESAEVSCDEAGQWSFVHKKGRRQAFEKKAETAKEALQQAEDWLYKNKPSIWSLQQRHTKNDHEPATPDQKKAIKAFGLTASVDSMTKGEARLILSHHFAKRRRYEQKAS